MRKIIFTLIAVALVFTSVGLCASRLSPDVQTDKAVYDGSEDSSSGKILLLDGESPLEEKDLEAEEFTQEIPVLAKAESEEKNLAESAKSAYLFDAASGTLIFSKNENRRLTIASMTKIMLLNLVFEAVENGELTLDEQIRVSERASSMGGSQVFLRANEQYCSRDLIKSVIVASANDASVALAERLYGTEDACVEEMNARREELGLTDTLFSNCTGLPKPTQYSSAHDVALMLRKLTSFEEYFSLSNIWLDELKHADGKTTTLTNTNRLVKFYSGCDGGKTGYTDEAKFCLACTAKRGNMRLIAVVIGEPSSATRFSEVSEMFDYGFAAYASRTVLDSSVPLGEVAAIKGGKQKSVQVAPKNDYFAFGRKNEKNDYEIEFSQTENLRAPIYEGDVVGKITVFKDGVAVYETDAVSCVTVMKKSLGDAIKEIAELWEL